MDKKRIGILTFSYSNNPGSVMQAHALQNTLSRICPDAEVSLINYQKTHSGKPLIGIHVFTRPIRSWTPKKVIRWTIAMLIHPIRMKKYKRFFNRHYNGYPTREITRDDLAALNRTYDLFVVGSDQVWNFSSPQVDATYLLDFVEDDTKKVAYAASFGQADISDMKTDAIKQWLPHFREIAVREQESIDTVRELAGKTAEWVLDPSLLLDKDEYSAIAVKPKEKKYVFLYYRHESPELEAFAEKMASHFGLELVRVFRQFKCAKNGKPVQTIGPEEWLGYMENAEYVVTNSFHGICFSLIFEKEFFVSAIHGEREATNTRISNILAQFDLSDRSADSVTDFDAMPRIDYQAVNQKIAQRREHSMDYLKKAAKKSK